MLGESGEAEIRDFEQAVVIEEEILRLDVAVEDAVLVAESEGGDDLLEVSSGGGFGEAAATAELGEELTALGELHYEVDFGFGGQYLVEFEDVGVVVEAAHGGDLAEDAGLHGGVDGGGLVDHFHGHLGVGVVQQPAEVYLGEAAAAEEAAELVFLEDDGATAAAGARGSSDLCGGGGRRRSGSGAHLRGWGSKWRA